MKKFLEEYGFAILAAIVVILLIAMSSPVGNLVKNRLTSIIESFAYKMETKLASVFGDNNVIDTENEPETTGPLTKEQARLLGNYVAEDGKVFDNIYDLTEYQAQNDYLKGYVFGSCNLQNPGYTIKNLVIDNGSANFVGCNLEQVSILNHQSSFYNSNLKRSMVEAANVSFDEVTAYEITVYLYSESTVEQYSIANVTGEYNILFPHINIEDSFFETAQLQEYDQINENLISDTLDAFNTNFLNCIIDVSIVRITGDNENVDYPTIFGCDIYAGGLGLYGGNKNKRLMVAKSQIFSSGDIAMNGVAVNYDNYFQGPSFSIGWETYGSRDSVVFGGLDMFYPYDFNTNEELSLEECLHISNGIFMDEYCFDYVDSPQYLNLDMTTWMDYDEAHSDAEDIEPLIHCFHYNTECIDTVEMMPYEIREWFEYDGTMYTIRHK